jgi:hypothetical protein
VTIVLCDKKIAFYHLASTDFFSALVTMVSWEHDASKANNHWTTKVYGHTSSHDYWTFCRKQKRDCFSSVLSITNAWPSVQIERDISKRRLSFRCPWARAKGAEPQISMNKSIIPTVHKHTRQISLSSCWTYLVVSIYMGPSFNNMWALEWICFSGTFLKWHLDVLRELNHLCLYIGDLFHY